MAAASISAASDLFSLRFIVVSGKGGVGRTTVAAALARAAVRAGKTVLLAQMDSPDRLARLFGRADRVGAEIVALEAGLHAVNMTAKEALHEYALMVLKYETIYRAVFENRAVRGFLSAIPGLDAFAMLGKAWWHTTETQGGRSKYDLVIVDAPASGHATTMLRIPKAIIDAIPKGPISSDAAAIGALLTDPTRAAVLVVTLAEELPARETSQLVRTVRQELHMPLGPLIVNALPHASWGHPALVELLATVPGTTGDPALDKTLEGAALLARRRQEADVALSRLALDPGLPQIELPRLPSTDLGLAELDELTTALAAQLQSGRRS